VLGGGFAGSYVARLLKRRGATIVSREKFMLYTPLLPEAASGTLEPRHVVVPLRQMCPHAELVLGEIESHDRERRTVAVDSLAGPLEIGYERLVIALGATTRTLPIPGLAENGAGFKDLADAIALRNHVLLQLERATIHPDDPAELGFVFVGAGYAGVEALGELNDMAQAALRSYPSLRGVPQRWVLVDAAPKILPEIPRGLGRYAARRLEKRGVEIHVGTTLESYDGAEAALADGTRIPARTLVWTAGVRASPLLPDLGLPLDERGRVVVDETMRVEGAEHVWSLGDCTAVKNVKTPGVVDPPTCQHALRQARRLAKNLTGTPKPYGYTMLGQVATLGHFKGIAELPAGIQLWGFPGWFVTRTYHLYQLPLWSRKLRVVVDWTVALFFRRDIVELSMLGHEKRLDGS
jgi:NADH:ubiquinone reductase (H+-translocating)